MADAIAAAAGCSPRLVVTVRAGRTRIVAAIAVWVRLLTLAAIEPADHGCFLVVTVRLRVLRLRGAWPVSLLSSCRLLSRLLRGRS